ncbi:MAG: hypothetical protein ACFFEF_05810 [Candidatus Thorarchaeota archaeon]
MSDKHDRKKDKSDYAEVEFEIGNIEFEAKGRSVVVERMFRLLLEKIEHGKLVATLKLPAEDEEYEEEEEEELVTPEDISIEEEISEFEASYEDTSAEESSDERTDETIPNEAYLDPPPAWDDLEDDSPPMSDAERDSID